MRLGIEGPDQLSNKTLEEIIDHYKHTKQIVSLARPFTIPLRRKGSGDFSQVFVS